jgi:hypothetical protein
MAEKLKKIVLTVKKKLTLIEKFDSRKSATKLAKNYGIGIKIVHDNGQQNEDNGICKGL